MRAALALLLLSSTALASPEADALARVNAYRAAAGLSAVKLDPALSKGCMEHARYMRANRGTDAMAGLNAHTQRPDLPGASAAGADCGKNADLFPGVSDLGTAIDGWMAGIYHRRPMMDPALQTIGVGYAALPDGSLMAALRFGASSKSTAGWPVRYPAADAIGIPLEYGNEVPNPIPNNGRGGYPITLQFPAFDEVTSVKATLVDATGKAVAFYASDPEHPATSFGQYGIVSLIPKRTLAPATRYTVTVDATWKKRPGTWTWSFTTVALRALDASDEAGITAALGVPSRVHGTVSYAGMMDSQTAFLQLGDTKPTRYEMLSVIIPLSVWKQLAGRAAPKTWIGKTVDVAATPQLVQGKYMNLPIADPAQLEVR